MYFSEQLSIFYSCLFDWSKYFGVNENNIHIFVTSLLPIRAN